MALDELSYMAPSDSELRGSLISELLALDELSYVALSSSFSWESACSFYAGLWRIGTDCMTSPGV